MIDTLRSIAVIMIDCCEHGLDHDLRSITMMLITVWSFDDCTWHWGDFGIVHAASMGAHWNFRKAFTKDPLKTVADHSLMLLNNRTMVEAVDLYMVDSRVSVASPVQWIQRAQTIEEYPSGTDVPCKQRWNRFVG